VTPEQDAITSRVIDQKTVARSFGRASPSYDAAADVQALARDELLSRLDHFRLEPQFILDLGSGTGLAASGLCQRFPQAHVLSIDLALPMLQRARQRTPKKTTWQRLHESLRGKKQGSTHWVMAEAAAIPLRTGSVQLVFTNLMLQWCIPPDTALAEIRRVLEPGGLLLCSTFGPTTLQELRAAWATVDDQPHVNDFIDMHDLGSAMARAGLSEPVLDVDRLRRDYRQVTDLLHELKNLGARNALNARRRSLTGKKRLAEMIKTYETRFSNKASWEIIYGSAFAPQNVDLDSARGKEPEAGGEVRIPLHALKRKPSSDHAD
jgi:malonyl-CoA O-methyltransferase